MATPPSCGRRISKHNATGESSSAFIIPLNFEDVFSGDRAGLDFVEGKKIAALSGIAQPESFEAKSAQEFGGELVYSKRFADHHRFSQQEILNVINRSKKRQAQAIITTQKDAVRFPKIDRRDLPIYFMRVEIKILDRRQRFS
jgi:tetraacyldisaccharide 4'-kinase